MKRAVALRYSEGDRAPVVVARGRDELALQILNEAKRCGIPIVEEPELVLVLEKLKTGMEIPDNLYRAVSDVFVFLIQNGMRR
jgi:flagellar biosynthesis protein